MSLVNCRHLVAPSHFKSSADVLARPDGRLPREMRAAAIKTGIVSDASGSCYLEVGGTKVVCSVRGPRAATGGGLNFSDSHGVLECELKFSPWHVSSGDSSASFGGGNGAASNVMNQTERQLSQQVHSACFKSIALCPLLFYCVIFYMYLFYCVCCRS